MTTKTTSSLIVKVKKELPSDEIKDFAETAMNELLGWYGYSNVDRNDLTKCSRFPTTTVHLEADLPASTGTSTHQVRQMRLSAATTTATSSVTAPSSRTTNSTPDRCNNSTSPESCGRHSKSPNVTTITNTTKLNDKLDVECGWCKRAVSLSSPEFLASPEGPRYCTESCFSQSRRASFKRAKTCDWCKHVRHAVSYVDFQDGASQLQFCSDKCLNQYKMQIFCKETQAHLDMNPHLKEKSSGNDGLITPDLWLRNCKSRSSSPSSDRSRSRSPVRPIRNAALSAPSSTSSHKPIITVTPSSKLMSRPNQFQHSLRLSPKSIPPVGRKRRSLRLSASTAEHTPKTITSINNGKCATTIQDLTANAQQKNIPSTKEAPSASKSNLPHHFLPPPPNLYPLRHGMMSSPGSHPRFMHPMHAAASQHHQQQQPRPPQHHMRPLHPSTAPSQPQNNATSSHNQQQSPIDTQPMPAEHIPPNQEPLYSADHQSRMFGVNPPPITILVPYPVIIPIPIPIPIPMPIIEFMRAAQYKMDLEKHFQNNNNVPSKTDPTDEPLDFTKTRDPVEESQPPNESDDHCASPPLSQLEDMITEEHHTITMSSATDEEVSGKDPNRNPLDAEDVPTKQPPQQQRLPKFKITRLNSRRIITSSSSEVAEPEISTSSAAIGTDMNVTASTPSPVIEISAETSRPLRKRKRLVNCDYSRLKDDDKKK